jgi:asparagine synthase (glutamine-hydrolysing)
MARHAQRALTHRGPDSTGLWQHGGTTLGHTRLSIIDLTRSGDQPMANERGDVVVCYNGEIYNFRDLRRKLQSHGHVFRSNTDTEVLVHGYEQWATNVVERLDGMFAFAVWDEKRRTLLLARDRPGKKPLFYHVGSTGEVTFASEIKAFWAHSQTGEGAGRSAPRPIIRPQAIVEYLTYGYVPGEPTFYEDVFELPPAHLLRLDGSGRPTGPESFSKPRRYWDISFESSRRANRPEGKGRPGPTSLMGTAREIRHLVDKAVEKRLISDVPLGAFLSGGLDSSIVVGLMARKLAGRVKTFSIGFSGDRRYDETRYARMVARRFSTDHTEFQVTPQDVELLDRLVWLHDGPFSDSSAIPTAMLCRMTRDHVTVALTGDGGDELFAGYLRLWAGALSEKIPSPLRKWLPPAAGLLPAGDERTPSGKARRFLKGLSHPLPDRMLDWQPTFAFELGRLVRPELMADVAEEQLYGFQRRLFARTRGQSPLARLLDHNYRSYLPYDLQVKMDRCSMGASLEARSPLLDLDLTEACAKIPDRLRAPFGMTKLALRVAFADMVPPAVLSRGKMGFGVPLDAWFRGDLRELVADHLLDPNAHLGDYLRTSEVARSVTAHLAGDAHLGHHIFSLLTLELWLRKLRT